MGDSGPMPIYDPIANMDRKFRLQDNRSASREASLLARQLAYKHRLRRSKIAKPPTKPPNDETATFRVIKKWNLHRHVPSTGRVPSLCTCRLGRRL